MLMTDIRDYLQLVGRANLQDLSRRFRIQESAMQHMLSFWIKKGQIEMYYLDRSGCDSGQCRDCFECSESTQQIYVWR